MFPYHLGHFSLNMLQFVRGPLKVRCLELNVVSSTEIITTFPNIPLKGEKVIAAHSEIGVGEGVGESCLNHHGIASFDKFSLFV